MGLSSLNNGLCTLAVVSACSGDLAPVQHSSRNSMLETPQKTAAPVLPNKPEPLVSPLVVEPMEPTKKMASCAKELKIVLASPDSRSPNPVVESTASYKDLLTVSAPIPNSTVSSPLTVTGEARGSWYFEASFPIELRDANGIVLTQTPATATGDWMTTDFVPFTATLTFTMPSTATGTLILKKDNPSGDPARDEQLEIPVQFY